ncbi:MAG: regulatory protein RecX [Nevskia sp.]|nr:regulatory protein RecX [Nevskia sp.]
MAARKPPDAEQARTRALRLLARREHSARELQHKLAVRGVEQAQAAAVVGELAQAGWQSDARYVGSLVRSRVAQGYGPLRIESELIAAGVAEPLAREALAGAGADWAQLAEDLRRRKFGALPAAAAQWQKQYRHLAARGFEARHIYRALKSEAPPEEQDP